jgi:hypothetical protein
MSSHDPSSPRLLTIVYLLVVISTTSQGFASPASYCRDANLSTALAIKPCAFPSRSLLTNQKNENDTEKSQREPDDSSTVPAPLTEEESSRRVFSRLMLPAMLGEAFNKAVWASVVFATFLTVAGYAIVVKDHSLVIDTMENKRFQDEINRRIK